MPTNRAIPISAAPQPLLPISSAQSARCKTQKIMLAAFLLLLSAPILFARGKDKKFIYITFDPPGSVETSPTSINSSGMTTGDYFDGNIFRGFVRDRDGEITTFEVAGSTATASESINAAGTITGFYFGTSVVSHGFVRDRDGTVTSFDPVGSINTQPVSISPDGTIVGTYNDASQVTHGFIRSAEGAIQSFDPPGSQATFVTSINAEDEIIGWYEVKEDLRNILENLRERP